MLTDLSQEEGRRQTVATLQTQQVKMNVLILNARDAEPKNLNDLRLFAESMKPQMSETPRILVITPNILTRVQQMCLDETLYTIRRDYSDSGQLSLATAAVASAPAKTLFQQNDQARLNLQNWSFKMGKAVLEQSDTEFDRSHFNPSGEAYSAASTWLDVQAGVLPSF
jgi:hypothetical protein